MRQLSSDDYYRYNIPFRAWLTSTYSLVLTELPTEQSRRLFSTEFAPLWNSGKLKDEFYDDKYTTDVRSSDLKSLINSEAVLKRARRTLEDEEAQKEVEKTRLKSATRSFSKFQKNALEEVCPPKEGRAAQLEKRRIKAAYTKHQKDVDVELKDIFDDSEYNNTSYQQALLKEKRRIEDKAVRIQREQLVKQAELEAKRQKHDQREQAVVAMFREMLDRKKS